MLSGDPQSGETARAIQACNDWLRLGPGRTLPELLRRYAKTPQYPPPTRALDTLKDWSARFGWETRGVAYDAAQDAQRTTERQRVFQHGLALDYARVRKLQKLAAFLEAQLYEQGHNVNGEQVFHNVWLPDVKSIGSGPSAERVDLERFNGDLIRQYRETLEDLAKETGGRVQKADITSGGQPLITADVLAEARARAAAWEQERNGPRTP